MKIPRTTGHGEFTSKTKSEETLGYHRYRGCCHSCCRLSLLYYEQSDYTASPPTGPNVTIWDGGVSCSNNSNCGYSPTNKTVTGGTTITWTNTGGKPHTVTECTTSDSSSACPNGAGANTSTSRAFDSNSQTTIQPNQQYQYTFNLPIGTYYYYCTLHPWMHGAIAIP